eukprot:gene33027-39951_t
MSRKPVAGVLLPFAAARAGADSDEELKMQVDLSVRPNIAAFDLPSLAGERVGKANFHPELDISSPPIMTPYVSESKLTQGARLTDVQKLDHDAMHEKYAFEFHDPTIEALDADKASSVLADVSLVTDRHILRDILRSCDHEPKDAFYSVRKDFDVVVTNVHGKVLLTPTVQERWERKPGGFSKGLLNRVVEYQSSSPDHEFSEDLMEDMCYYEVMHTNVGGLGMLVRYKVDALDSRGDAVEFKSRKQPNPRYPLGPDYFRHIWGQMALSTAKYTWLVYHKDGVITQASKLDLASVQRKAGFEDDQAAKRVLARLVNFLRWLVHRVSEHGMQSKLLYRSSDNSFQLDPVRREDRIRVMGDEAMEMLAAACSTEIA